MAIGRPNGKKKIKATRQMRKRNNYDEVESGGEEPWEGGDYYTYNFLNK